jgi:hypothetical protein
MCTSASKKKHHREVLTCTSRVYAREKGCGGCGGLRGILSGATFWRSKFFVTQALKNRDKKFKLFSLYGSTAIPRKFSVCRNAVGQKHPATLRTLRKVVFQHYNSISGLRGIPRTARSNHFTDVHRTLPVTHELVSGQHSPRKQIRTYTPKGKRQTDSRIAAGVVEGAGR